MKCSIRHNVKEHLLHKELAAQKDGKLMANRPEEELMSDSYRVAQSLLERFGTSDLPYTVQENEVILNDDLFRRIDGASPEVQQDAENELLMSMRHLMKQWGISEQVVDKLRDREGNPIQGVAAADLLNRSIQYLEGNESELPEEVIHFYVQALKDTLDPLYTSMRARITSEPEYEQVTRDYQDLGYTQEDIIDEAIAKVILNRVKPQVKTGVSELFESNPELANIGTPQQYSEYLNTIFPDSKVKDIVYHGSYQQEKLDNFLNKSKAFHKNVYYFLDKKTDYGDKFINALVNLKNPSQGSTASSNFNEGNGKEKHFEKGFDGVIADQENKFYINTSLEHLLEPYKKTEGTTQREIIVFEPEQIHILGSKQDIEGFKAFVSKGKSEDTGITVSEKLFNPDLAPDGYSRTILQDGKTIGEFALSDRGNEVYLIGSLGAATELFPEFQGKGLGYAAYVALGNSVALEGKTLFSDTQRSEKAENLWKRLENNGFAVKVGDRYRFTPIQQSENTGDRNTRWWNRVLRRLKEMFNVGTESADPFKQAAIRIFREDMSKYQSTVSQITNGTIMRSLGDKQALLSKSIADQHNRLKIQPTPVSKLEGKLDPLLLEKAEDGKIQRYELDGQLVLGRASDRHALDFEKKNRGKVMSESAKKRTEAIRLAGTDMHEVNKHLIQRLAMKNAATFNLPDLGHGEPMKTVDMASEYKLSEGILTTLTKNLSEIMKEVKEIQQGINPAGKVDVLPEVSVYDKVTDTAGTIDLLFVFSDGSYAIYDYKFINPSDRYLMDDGITLRMDPFFMDKLNGYAQQLRFYSTALERSHGLMPQDRRRARLVPGHVKLSYDKTTKDYKVSDLYMGAKLSEAHEPDRFLSHIPVLREVTDSEQMNNKLLELYSKLDKLKEGKGDTSPASKAEINTLTKAIREILTGSDLYMTLQDMRKAVEIAEKEDLEKLSDSDLSMNILRLKQYRTIRDIIRTMQADNMRVREGVMERVQEMEKSASLASDRMESEYDKRAFERNYDLNAIVQKSGFKDYAITLNTHHSQIVQYGMRLVSEGKFRAEQELRTYMDRLDALRPGLESWAKSNGRSLQDAYDLMIMERPWGRTLVPVLSDEFKTLRAEMQEKIMNDKDIAQRNLARKWADSVYKVKEGAKERYMEDLKRAEQRFANLSGKGSLDYEQRLQDWITRHDVWKNPDARLQEGKRYMELTEEALNKYMSERYRFINDNPPLKAWLDEWKKIMAEVDSKVDRRISPNFIPAVPVAMGEVISNQPGYVAEHVMDGFKRNFTIEMDMDERMGGEKRSIPLAFTSYHKGSNGKIDPRMYSTDMRAVMYRFLDSALKHEQLADIEPQLLLLEQKLINSKVAPVINGELVRDKAEEIDSKTVDIFRSLLSSELYGNRFDQNTQVSVLGKKISLEKTVLAARSMFSSIRMTLPVRAALAATISGESLIRAQIASNPNFGGENVYRKTLRMMVPTTKGVFDEKLDVLLDEFDSRAELVASREAREARHSFFNRYMDPHYQYKPLVETDNLLHGMTMGMMLHSFAIVDNELVRIENLPEGTKSIIESVEVKDGKLVTPIPENIKMELSLMHRMEMLQITGSMSQYDFAAYRANLIADSFMQFKGWMPGLLQGHFGETQYVEMMKRMTEGKYRGAFKTLGASLTASSDELQTEVGMAIMTRNAFKIMGKALMTLAVPRTYVISKTERDRKKKGGSWSEAQENEFQDRRRRLMAEFEQFKRNAASPRFRNMELNEANLEEYIRMREGSVRGTMVEIKNVLILSLLSMLATSALDDDEDRTSSYLRARYTSLMERTIMEMAQFMSPIEMMKVIKQPMPLLGLAEMGFRLGQETLKRGTLLLTGQDVKAGSTPYPHYFLSFFPGYNNIRFVLGMDN